MANNPELPVVPQNRQIPVIPAALVRAPPSRYSTRAFSVLESAKATLKPTIATLFLAELKSAHLEARRVWFGRIPHEAPP